MSGFIDLIRTQDVSRIAEVDRIPANPLALPFRTSDMANPHRTLFISLVVSAVAAAGCASEDPPVAKRPAAAEVEVVNISFSPATLEIESGTEVVWTNQDEGVNHTATSGLPGDNGVPGVSKPKPPKPNGVFDGDLPDVSSQFTFTFTESGTYAYFCRIHPSMTGEVIVL